METQEQPGQGQDRLRTVVEALRKKPDATNEEIAQLLGLQRPMSAVMWKVKAKQLLQQETGERE